MSRLSPTIKQSKHRLYRLAFGVGLLCAFMAQAELAVTVLPVKTTGQKAIVPLKFKNNFPEKVESARAICFLLDSQGKMVGQSAKWVIGQNKIGIPAGATNSYNFVITSPQPFTSTNLTAKVNFTRIVLEGDKLANLPQDVKITP